MKDCRPDPGRPLLSRQSVNIGEKSPHDIHASFARQRRTGPDRHDPWHGDGHSQGFHTRTGARPSQPCRLCRPVSGWALLDIASFIDKHNNDPKPFRWTKSADDILKSIERFCLYNAPAAV
ncbi:MAG: hypothetical protein E6G85_18775 [Alphaproteobacteria bacterium]|nr:MAG: hypothetical protein E6G85_18775 [Alphaproteobacteria bacterium]